MRLPKGRRSADAAYRGGASQLQKCDPEGARRHEQEAVIAGELHGLTLPADEVDGREMKRVEGANGNRKGLLREPRPAVSTPPASVARSTFA